MTRAGWNFAKVWQRIAQTTPDAVAAVHDGVTKSWRDFDAESARIAARMKQDGVSRQGKVALYLRNGPEYMQTAFAAFKAGLVPVNVNYRYGPEEVLHILEDADVEAVVFHRDFAPVLGQIKDSLDRVASWICVADTVGAIPDWAVDFSDVVAQGEGFVDTEISGDDLLLIYTGGTTGKPKGVIWRQHDMYMASNTTGDPAEADLEHVASRVSAAKRVPVGLSAAPLMHGTGFVFAMTILSRGGRLVSQTEKSFDPVRLLDLIEKERVSDMCIVGDAFARPLVDALDSEPARWDIGCLKAISSSGMVWTQSVKDRIMRHLPDTLLIDFLNSSEASGMGRSISSGRGSSGQNKRESRFTLGKNVFVIGDDDRPLEAGDERAGRLAVKGYIPLGYYKDPAKTAATFVEIDGVRCSIPGDYARITKDGEIELLGRGSATINTGGEKVFAEEVEAAIKSLNGVRDALVVGLPDERFGQVIAAAVEAPEGTIAPQRVIDHVRGQLARYKAPRHVMIADDIGRTITGKADYAEVRRRIGNWLLTTQGKKREVQ